jgi:hypothetical protein
MPQPLLGSAESLARQNQINESEGLERILDNDDLDDRIAQHLLVPVPATSSLLVNGSLPQNRRYCRTWTARFLTDFARAHAARFHRPILVTSAVRTVEYQKQLILVNGNAAAAEGDVASPHPYRRASRSPPAAVRPQLLHSHECDSVTAGLGYNRGQPHVTSEMEPGLAGVRIQPRIQLGPWECSIPMRPRRPRT